MNIGLDLDGVVYDFGNEFDQWLTEKRLITIARANEYALDKRYDLAEEKVKEYMSQFVEEDRAFLWVPLFDGAKEAINELSKIGEIYVISNRAWTKSGPALTRLRIEMDGLPIKKDLIYFSNDKGIYADILNLDIFYEDSIENSKKILKHSKAEVILIDRPYNKYFKSPKVKRFRSLMEAVNG